MKKATKISEKYNWPIVTSKLIKEISFNELCFPADIEPYVVNDKVTVREKVKVSVTPLKMWTRCRKQTK